MTDENAPLHALLVCSHRLVRQLEGTLVGWYLALLSAEAAGVQSEDGFQSLEAVSQTVRETLQRLQHLLRPGGRLRALLEVESEASEVPK
jgi:hypothetical protein